LRTGRIHVQKGRAAMFDLKGFIKKQFIDILQWTEDSNGVLSWRFPMADMEIQYGASLTVRESQMAVFVNEGKAADAFAPGMYKLTTQTIPILTYLKNWDKLFESPFKSDVYFFSTRLQLDRKWGTQQPVTIRDKDFGMVRLRAFGNYAFKIADPKKFHQEVSGTRDVYTVDDLDGQLRTMFLTGIADMCGSSGIPFLDLAANQEEFGNLLKENLVPKFERLGLALDQVQVASISLPEELQAILDKRIGMNMVGNMDQFLKYQTGTAIPVAAANPGGGIAGTAADMGIGLAMGQMMAQGMAGAMNPMSAQNQAAAAAAAGGAAAPAATVKPEDVMATLEKMHDLKTKGILSEEEFAAKKAELLKKLV
jgi:membrane protease subunit (stomatin/prohibitin family)